MNANGISDFIYTTTSEPSRGIILTTDMKVAQENVQQQVGENEVKALLPKAVIGENFDWSAFTGYSPREGAYYAVETAAAVHFLPEVDWAHASSTVGAHPIGNSMIAIDKLLSSGALTVIYKSKVTTCPSLGNTGFYSANKKLLQPMPTGHSGNGLLLNEESWPNLGYKTKFRGLV